MTKNLKKKRITISNYGVSQSETNINALFPYTKSFKYFVGNLVGDALARKL